EAVLPLLVRQNLDSDVGAYALLNVLSATGAIAAAMGLGQTAKLRQRLLLLYSAWLVATAASLAVGLPSTAIGVELAIFIGGVGSTTLGFVWMDTLQEIVPSDRLGHVASIDALSLYVRLPAGYGLAGLAADRLDAAPAFVLGGALAAALLALGL